PADVKLIGNTTGAVRGSLIFNSSNTGFTFLKTGGPTGGGTAGLLAADIYTVTFFSGVLGFKDLSGALLDGNHDGINGDNYVTTFTVASSSAVAVTVPDFARGPDGTDVINVPNTSSNGIPITLSNGAGVTSGTLTLKYDPTLLSITAAVVNSSL